MFFFWIIHETNKYFFQSYKWFFVTLYFNINYFQVDHSEIKRNLTLKQSTIRHDPSLKTRIRQENINWTLHTVLTVHYAAWATRPIVSWHTRVWYVLCNRYASRVAVSIIRIPYSVWIQSSTSLTYLL